MKKEKNQLVKHQQATEKKQVLILWSFINDTTGNQRESERKQFINTIQVTNEIKMIHTDFHHFATPNKLKEIKQNIKEQKKQEEMPRQQNKQSRLKIATFSYKQRSFVI